VPFHFANHPYKKNLRIVTIDERMGINLCSRTMGDRAKKTLGLGDLCECEDCLAASDDQ